jgi:hypothetical protein
MIKTETGSASDRSFKSLYFKRKVHASARQRTPFSYSEKSFRAPARVLKPL